MRLRRWLSLLRMIPKQGNTPPLNGTTSHQTVKVMVTKVARCGKIANSHLANFSVKQNHNTTIHPAGGLSLHRITTHNRPEGQTLSRAAIIFIKTTLANQQKIFWGLSHDFRKLQRRREWHTPRRLFS